MNENIWKQVIESQKVWTSKLVEWGEHGPWTTDGKDTHKPMGDEELNIEQAVAKWGFGTKLRKTAWDSENYFFVPVAKTPDGSFIGYDEDGSPYNCEKDGDADDWDGAWVKFEGPARIARDELRSALEAKNVYLTGEKFEELWNELSKS